MSLIIYLRSKYGLTKTDEEISLLSKEKWKSLVKAAINDYVLDVLNLENSQKKKTSHLPPYTELLPQQYFEFLSPADSRLFFSIRSGTSNRSENTVTAKRTHVVGCVVWLMRQLSTL